MAACEVSPTGRMIRWSVIQTPETDTTGGKPQFASLVGTDEVCEHAGSDLITMNVDDLARKGSFPGVMINTVEVKNVTQENFHLFEALMRGYERALKTACLVNMTGETAIVRDSITAFCDTNSIEQIVFLWSGSCIGLTRKDFRFDGSTIQPGMPVVGFHEHGYRCNGGGFCTDLIRFHWGTDPRALVNNPKAREFARELTKPSISYAKTITRIVGWNQDGTAGTPLAKIHGAAHITGGGLWAKLAEILPKGVGVHLNSMPTPAPVLQQAYELSQSMPEKDRMSPWTFNQIFHGGCGMLAVCEPGHEEVIIAESKRDGITASVVGYTLRSALSEITIQSRIGPNELLSSLQPK